MSVMPCMGGVRANILLPCKKNVVFMLKKSNFKCPLCRVWKVFGRISFCHVKKCCVHAEKNLIFNVRYAVYGRCSGEYPSAM